MNKTKLIQAKDFNSKPISLYTIVLRTRSLALFTRLHTIGMVLCMVYSKE
jgi:hypothetical protein